VLPKTRAQLQRPGRRRFLWSIAALGLTPQIGMSEKRQEPVFRFLTPVCEVRMSVQYFAGSSINGFHFRDDLTNRTFCLSADGEQDRDCLNRFVGSMAIAHYRFRSRLQAGTPLHLRERVLTIDHDRRISPRAPFERVMAVERAAVSDIQAFGYNGDYAEQTTSNPNLLAVWYFVRQDLYLNDQATPFLVVHWKHTLDFISLLDVIPGDGTQLISNY
jgi:hypothetical protein